MRRVLTSFAFGPQERLHDLALPTFAAYAQQHEYDLFVPRARYFHRWEHIIAGRHPAWFKILLLIDLLSSYDEVLWIDADVVVRDYDRDIADDASAAPMSVVVQNTADGAVPSTGVWFLRRPAIDLLDRAWHLNSFGRSDGWWEQAAIVSVLGGDPDATPVSVPASDLWGELPYEWNPHIRDPRGVTKGRFFHATMFGDRAQAMLYMRRMPG